MADLSMPACAGNPALPAPEPSDLAVAVRVAQLLLAEYEHVDHADLFALNRAHGALTETLRILLRALDSQAGEHR